MAQSIDKNTLKTIRIKTNVLKRSQKDYSYYLKQIETEGERLVKIKEDLEVGQLKKKQQQQVLEESKQMLLGAKTKITQALEDVKDLVSDYQDNPDAKELKQIKDAFEQIQMAQNFIQNM